MNNQNNDAISDADLDKASGGFGFLFLAVAANQVRQGTKGETPTGGKNDPAQMFQQILQQLTGQ
jgi:hypothetical protein